MDNLKAETNLIKNKNKYKMVKNFIEINFSDNEMVEISVLFKYVEGKLLIEVELPFFVVGDKTIDEIINYGYEIVAKNFAKNEETEKAILNKKREDYFRNVEVQKTQDKQGAFNISIYKLNILPEQLNDKYSYTFYHHNK